MGRPKKEAKQNNSKCIRLRKTVTRRLADKDYILISWILNNKEKYDNGEILDISIYDPDTIDESIKTRYFYVTEEENELIKDYIKNHPRKVSVSDLIADCGWKKDSKFVTKPDGSTIRFKPVTTKLSESSSATNEKQSLSVDKKDGDNTYIPTQTYPVYSDEERMQLAIKLERTPTDDNTLVTISDEWLNSVDMSQFLFVKDLNKQCEHVNEIDYHVLFYMIETGKLSPIEAKLILTKVGAETVLERRPYDFRDYGVPEFYHDDPSLISAMLKAKTFTYKYQKMLADGSPSEEHILERFKDWIKNEKSLAIEQNQLSKIQYDPDMEVTNIDIDDKTVTLTYNDINEGDNLTVIVEYDSKEDMLDDFVCFEYAFKIDPNQQYNIWGEMISINDYIRQLYAKYPHGSHGGFYATMKEAYEAGAACINEVA